MKKTQMLPLAAIISGLLVGCGGGGGGGGGGAPAEPTYTWQFVHLHSESRTSIAANCVIFADDSSIDGNAITASIADEGFKILFHNSDGSIVSSETISDIPDTGKVEIRSGAIPDDGYVSLEEVVGGLGNRNDVYMFTLQKDLMTDLVLNVRQQSNRSNQCYQGEQYSLTVSDDAAVAVAQSSVDTSYYQSSYINSMSSGSQLSANIPVKAPLNGTKRALVTAFDTVTNNGAGDEFTDLMYFAVIPSESIYDKNNPPSTLPSVSMLDSDNSGVIINANRFSIDNTSRVDVAIDNELYQWQPIYSDSTTISYSSNGAFSDGWNVKANGTSDAGNWNVNTLTAFEGNDISISVPAVNDFSTTTIDSSCTADYCLNTTGFTPSDFNIQRTHVRGSTTLTYDFYQSIYAVPSTNQALMESSVVDYQVQPSDRIEVSLGTIDLDNADSKAWFMERNMNLQSIVDIDLANFTDVNGSITQPSAVKTRNVSMLGNSVSAVENGVN